MSLYSDKLDIMAAEVVMGWEKASLPDGPAHRFHIWCVKGAIAKWRIDQSAWHPCRPGGEGIGMLLDKILGDDKAYRINLINRHSTDNPVWLAEVYGSGSLSARDLDEDSWRIALVRALILAYGGPWPPKEASGGELPEETR